MRLFQFNTVWTILLDFFVWAVIHLGVVLIMNRFSRDRFKPCNRLCRPRRWEREGRLYEQSFAIKKWKKYLPDGAQLAPESGFPKKRLQDKSLNYLNIFAMETCRAELTHWVFIMWAPVFFLWNKMWVGLFMIGYALAENLPFILTQRYNRVRLLKVLSRQSVPINDWADRAGPGPGS